MSSLGSSSTSRFFISYHAGIRRCLLAVTGIEGAFGQTIFMCPGWRLLNIWENGVIVLDWGNLEQE